MKFAKALMLCVSVSGFCQAAYALPIVQTAACINNAASTCATGVTGLDVLGTLYDVIFSQASYNDLFTATPPAFFGDDLSARAAATALISPLNSASIVGLLGDPRTGGVFMVPVKIIADSVQSEIADYTTGSDFALFPAQAGLYYDGDAPSSESPGYYDAYAVFTPSTAAVPAPPILWLFGLGLVGISLSRRKRHFPV